MQQLIAISAPKSSKPLKLFKKPGRDSLLHSFVLADQALVSGSNFLLGVLLTRKLPLDQVGQYWLLMAVVFFGGTIQLALIVSPMMSVGPLQDRWSAKEYLIGVTAQEYAFVFAYSIIALGVLCGLRLIGVHIPSGVIIPLLCANAAYLLQDFYRRALFFQKKAMLGLFSDTISYLGQIAILWFLLTRSQLSLSSILWISAATSTVALLLVVFKLPIARCSIETLRAIAIRNWASGRYLLGAAVLQWGSGSLFGLVAPAFLGAAVAGIMRACQSLVNATNIWVQGLENSLPSQASERYRAGGPAALKAYLMRAETLLVGGTLGLASAVIVAPKFWLQLLYGHRLDGYGFLLQAYAILAVFSVAGLPIRAGLRAIERTKPVFVGYVVSTIFSAIAAPLVPGLFGLKGVSVALIFTQVLTLPILFVSLRRGLNNTKAWDAKVTR